MTEIVFNAPDVRIRHNPGGWTLPALSPNPQTCTTNHAPEYATQPPCTDTAAWRVTEIHEDLNLTLSFWCDTHLPTEHRRPAPAARPHAAA